MLSSGGDSSLCSSDGGWSPQLSETLHLVKAGWEFERDPLLIRHCPRAFHWGLSALIGSSLNLHLVGTMRHSEPGSAL